MLTDEGQGNSLNRLADRAENEAFTESREGYSKTTGYVRSQQHRSQDVNRGKIEGQTELCNKAEGLREEAYSVRATFSKYELSPDSWIQ